MTPDPALLDAIERWDVIAGFCISALFPLVVVRWWPWWKSTWGWNIVLLEISIAGVLFPSFLYMAFGITDLPLKWVSAVLLALVPAIVIWRTLIIRNTQITEARADHADRDGTADTATADRKPAAD